MAPGRSYVLRCWPAPTGSGERVTWRFSLLEAGPEARRRAFNDLDDLVLFLREELARPEPASSSDDES